jgi:hypothetical protein
MTCLQSQRFYQVQKYPYLDHPQKLQILLLYCLELHKHPRIYLNKFKNRKFKLQKNQTIGKLLNNVKKTIYSLLILNFHRTKIPWEAQTM